MFILPDTKKVALAVSFLDAAGNAAVVEGVPTWSSSDDAIVTIADVSADGLSAFAVATGPLGTAQVSVSADADLGAGVTTISGVLDIDVQASQAVSAAIGATAEPVDK